MRFNHMIEHKQNAVWKSYLKVCNLLLFIQCVGSTIFYGSKFESRLKNQRIPEPDPGRKKLLIRNTVFSSTNDPTRRTGGSRSSRPTSSSSTSASSGSRNENLKLNQSWYFNKTALKHFLKGRCLKISSNLKLRLLRKISHKQRKHERLQIKTVTNLDIGFGITLPMVKNRF